MTSKDWDPMLRTLVYVCLAVVPLIGCSVTDRSEVAEATESTPLIVVVVGDKTAPEVVDAFRNSNVSLTKEQKQISSASLVVIAQDATTGPTPIHRNLVREIAAVRNRDVLWILTKSSQVKDPELLDLELLESRQLLNKYGQTDETIQFALDSEGAPTHSEVQVLKGWPAIERFVQRHRS